MEKMENMENKKNQWGKEESLKHLKICAIMVIVGGTYGLFLSLDDIVILGNRLSAFIFPYLFNYILFALSVFQVYTGVAFLKRKKWAKICVLGLLLLRLLLGYYDTIEIWPAVITLPYFIYIIHESRVGWLFKEGSNSENTQKTA